MAAAIRDAQVVHGLGLIDAISIPAASRPSAATTKAVVLATSVN
jgi:hypothetical protein